MADGGKDSVKGGWVRRWGRRLFRVGLLLVLVGLALWIFWLPGFVEGRIRAAMREAGFEAVAFDLAGVSTGRLTLTDVAIGEGDRLHAAVVSAAYSTADLRAGRVDTITITGPRYTLTVREDGTLDWGPLRPLLEMERPDRPATMLPFRKLLLRDGTVTVRYGEQSVGFEALVLTFQPLSDGTGREMRLDGRLADQAVRFNVRLELEHAPDAPGGLRVRTVVGRIDVDSLRVGGQTVRDLSLVLPRVGMAESTARLALWWAERGIEGDLTVAAERTLVDAVRTGSPLSLRWRFEAPLIRAIGEAGRQRLAGSKVTWSGEPTATFTGEATVDPAQRRIDIDQAALTAGANGIDLGGDAVGPLDVRLDLAASGGVEWDGLTDPARLFDGMSMTGELRVENLVVAERALPPLVADVTWRDGAIQATADYGLTDHLPIAITGSFDPFADAAPGEVTFTSHDGRITPGDALGEWVHGKTGLNLTGGVRLDGRLAWTDGTMAPRIVIGVRDMTVAYPEVFTAAGVNGRATFDGLAPPRTPAGQRVTWDTLTIGEIKMDNGTLRWQMAGPSELRIEYLTWRQGEARFWMQSAALDPRGPDVVANVFVENLSLSDWLSVVTMDYASGSGRLSGRMLLRLTTEPRLKIGVGAGQLIAAGDGRWRVNDAEMVERMLDANAPTLGGQTDYSGLVRDRIVQALQDFQYEQLRFVFREEAEETVLRIDTRGEGRTNGQVLVPTFNIRGVNAFFDQALRLKLGMQREEDALVKKLRPEASDR